MVKVKWLFLISPAAVLLIWTSCTQISLPKKEPYRPVKMLSRMGYAIQAGAFRNLNNAIRLAQSLSTYDLNAYYFMDNSGLYKVRFGNFTTKEAALEQAEKTRFEGIITEFYIVNPFEYPVVKKKEYGRSSLRDEIVERAENYIGLPYQWGGTSPRKGFDCSGLTMAVYRLVGLDLPRTSNKQFNTGRPIQKSQLTKGDLVFFSPSGRQVSHVGIYTGGNTFIHAPGKKKRIRKDSLADNYFKTTYAGARTYL